MSVEDFHLQILFQKHDRRYVVNCGDEYVRFQFILVIKCSIIINERKKKHCHFGGCYIWRHLIIQSVAYTICFFFCFTFTRAVLKQIETK